MFTLCAVVGLLLASNCNAASKTSTRTRTRTSTSSATAASASMSPSPPTPIDWLQHGFDSRRSFLNDKESTLTSLTASKLALKWKVPVDGATVGSPLLANGVMISGGTFVDLVISGTEAGTLYALNAATGATVWSKALGSTTVACDDMPASLWGIGGTPLIDRSSGDTVYVASAGKLYALALGSGSAIAGYNTPLLYDQKLLHNYGGISAFGGSIYVAVGGQCDNGAYTGAIYRVHATTGALLGVRGCCIALLTCVTATEHAHYDCRPFSR